MRGQGAIIGVGAMEYPAEYQGASDDTIARNAHQQDHDADARRTTTASSRARSRASSSSGVHELLLGEDGFYDEIFRALRIPYEPIRWKTDIATSHDDEISKQARILELIHAYRVRGHLMADIDPLEYRQRTHPDLEIETHGLTLWDLDREFATGGFGGKGRPFMKLRDILGVLRDSYCRTIGIEYMHILDPEQRRWIQERVERPHTKPPREEQLRILLQAQRGRGVRDLPADQVRRPEALQPRGRRVHDPAARRDLRGRRRGRPRRGRDRHGPPRPAQRAHQHRRQDVPPDLPRVRGQHRPAHRPGLRRREVPPRRRGQVRRRPRRQDQGLASPPTRRTSRPSTRCSRASSAPSRTCSTAAPTSPCCRCSCTATRRSPARAWSPRRSTCRSCAATAPAARSTSSSTTRSASPPRPARRAPRCTPPTWPG